MIGTVIEGIFEVIIEYIFRLIVEIICFYTGEMILSVVTMGNRKPRWDYYSGESVTKWMLMTELSTCIGIFFWIFTIGFVARSFSYS
jgi:hypothetical protein